MNTTNTSKKAYKQQFAYISECELAEQFPDFMAGGNTQYKKDKRLAIYNQLVNYAAPSDYATTAELAETLTEYAPKKNGKQWTGQETRRYIEKYIECVENTNKGNEFLVEVFSTINGEQYEQATIRGTTQSEWQVVILPTSQKNCLPYYEALYFGMVDEWEIVDESEPDGMPETLQTFWFENAVEVIQSEYGNDIAIFDIAGYRQVPDYKQIA